MSKRDPSWTYPNPKITLDDLRKERLFKPGLLVEVRSVWPDGTAHKSQLLVGHINEVLGECDDCTTDKNARVLRYKRVWEGEA